ncbi:MAG TPA: Hsp20/alpha crystallin family protein [bacterium]|nr:Hsp20/alpha crystallin family protein [bacterium]
MSRDKSRQAPDIETASTMEDELDFLFSNFFGSHYPTLYRKELSWRPPTDFYEIETDYVAILELAQVGTDDVSVTLQDGMLSIRGNRKAVPPAERRRYHKMEIHYGPFEQRIAVPGDIDMENLSAHYKDGFLEIRLPKKPASSAGVVDIKVE